MEREDERRFPRYIAAVLVGIVTGAVLWAAIQAGVKFNYEEEAPLENWGFLFWGEHWLIRLLWSLAATSVAAFLAGLVARKEGPLIGILSALPTTFVWFACIPLWSIGGSLTGGWNFSDLSLGNKILTLAAPVGAVFCGYFFGRSGQNYAFSASAHFDKRPHTFLGIKWYNHLWVPLVLYAIVLESAWAVDYGLAWVRAQWAAGFGLWAFISSLFLMAIIGCLALTWEGLRRAYDYLSDRIVDRTRVESAKGVIRYGFGYVLLATVLQGAISLVPLVVSKLFR